MHSRTRDTIKKKAYTKINSWGPSVKYVTLEGVQEGVTVWFYLYM